MAFQIRCSVCRKAFPHQPGKDPWPDTCPLCHVSLAHNRADDDVVMPFIRTSKSTLIDSVYRDVEKTSEVRAERAAEMVGVPVSEMSGLKVTNLNDARHEGDVAAVPVVNDVTRIMDRGIGGFQGANGSEFAAGVKQGPYPNAGARMHDTIRRINQGG